MTMQAITKVYKTADAIDLKLHLFLPDAPGPRAAILFFHGGRFIQGHPAQFFPHCRYLATRGLVAASATYRLLGKTASSILDCFADSQAAIRWLRSQAADLAINPAQIVVAGGSAGANLAANAAMQELAEETREEEGVSARPNALVLLSPAVVRPRLEEDLIDERLYAQLSPKAQLPPMLLLHGSADEFFTTDAMQHFCEAMTAAGNLCVLRLYPNGKHGFFNYGQENNQPFYETLIEIEQFLRALGMLQGNSTLTDEMIASLRHEGDWQV